MDALRKAAEQALEALEFAERNHGGDDCYADSITALRAALAEQDQEPVATVENGTLVRSNLPPGYTGPLYTHPPRREWVGLTDEEIRLIVNKSVEGVTVSESVTFRAVARAIEAKLKERNHG